jgi:hypothetical protein
MYMNTSRLNITLPGDVVKILAAVKNKSAYIADAIKEKKRLDEAGEKTKKLEAAYRQAAAEDYETCKEWEDTLKDGIDDDSW